MVEEAMRFAKGNIIASQAVDFAKELDMTASHGMTEPPLI